MTIVFSKPLLGFAAFSGTGKTTLLTKILPILKSQGLRVAMIKHAHHKFDIDTPGKDSYELRKAGASPMLIASSRRIAVMIDLPEEQEPDLRELLHYINPKSIDLVLVEGFKHDAFPKIELHRPTEGHPLLYTQDNSIIAIASDAEEKYDTKLPQLDINNADAIATFIIQFVKNRASI